MRHHTLLTVIVLVIGGPPALCAEEEGWQPNPPVATEVVRLLKTGDSMLAIGHIQEQGSPVSHLL